jgi:hypothetical protein
VDALECIACGARWQGSTVRIVMARHGACPVCDGGVRLVYGARERASAEDQGEWLLSVAAARLSDADLSPSTPGAVAEARQAVRTTRRRRAELVERREELCRRRDALAATIEEASLRHDLGARERSALETSATLLAEVATLLQPSSSS